MLYVVTLLTLIQPPQQPPIVAEATAMMRYYENPDPKRGVAFLKELLKPSNPKGSYGPYAYGLSGYSNVLNEFLGGDGQIGIHGTNDPSSVGKNVSHGCIRMKNAAITKLAKMLPLGVPVQMLA